jgi:hypothetical protein
LREGSKEIKKSITVSAHVGAVTRGTTAGYSAVLAGEDAGKAMADHLREAKARDKRRNEMLSIIISELRAGRDVRPTIVEHRL